MDLNYTEFANRAYEKFEHNLFELESKDCYPLLESKTISLNELLWYQAYEGYYYLTETQFKNEMTASEVRRYIFMNKMNGRIETRISSKKKEPMTVYITDDGEYKSLKEEKLVNKMVEVIQNGFKQTKMQDNLLSIAIPTNPERLKQKFLLGGTTERWPLIRLALALEMKPDDFHRILTEGAFFRDLSAAVPREMIILYCLENGIYKGETVSNLLDYAETRKRELQRIPRKNNKKNTATFQELVKLLHGMDVEEFKHTALEDSCRYEYETQDINEKQFSITAKEMIINKTFGEKNFEFNRKRYEANDSVFLTDTILNYGKIFPLDEYDFPQLRPDMVMSHNIFFRFLNYRVVAPGAKCRVIYSMNSGDLPEEISNSVMTYTKLMNYPERSHRIERDDILVVSFYYFLLERWADGKHAMIASSQEEADRIWRSFMNEANTSLTNTGYAKLTKKNPLDAMFSIVMHSVNPLECYARIYELNVLSSMAKEGYSSENYPSQERTKNVINELVSTYIKFMNLQLIQAEKLEKVDHFAAQVKKAYVSETK